MNIGKKYDCFVRTVEKDIGRFSQAERVLYKVKGYEPKYAKNFVYTENVNIRDKST